MRKSLSSPALWIVVWQVMAVAKCAGSEVRVTADSLNLRAGPDEQSEVVSQASKGDIIVAVGDLQGDWVKIVPPAGANLWV